jgi:hypothetical protein
VSRPTILPSPPTVPPIHCTDGPGFYQVRILSEQEWESLPESQRPARAEYVPGVGWVVALPKQNLN